MIDEMKNAEGYIDTTAGEAVQNVTADELTRGSVVKVRKNDGGHITVVILKKHRTFATAFQVYDNTGASCVKVCGLQKEWFGDPSRLAFAYYGKIDEVIDFVPNDEVRRICTAIAEETGIAESTPAVNTTVEERMDKLEYAVKFLLKVVNDMGITINNRFNEYETNRL